MSFRIVIRPSGTEFQAEPGQTILDAARASNIPIPFSCRGGSCGSCKGKVLAGKIEYLSEELPALSDTEAGLGMALFCQAVAVSELEIEIRSIGVHKDIVVKTLPCRVAKMERVAPDVMRLFLRLPLVEEFRYLAGQYLDILLRDGRRRSFSIANAPSNGDMLELHIRLIEGGSFTPHVFHEMQEKALLRFEGPLGAFYLHEESVQPKIFVAGGTGFAPVKAMLEHAFHLGRDEELFLYWGVRNRQSLYLPDLPQHWAAQHPNFHFVPVLSDPAPTDQWQGRTGYVHAAVAADFPDLGGHQVYASGPPAMVDAARVAFRSAGLPDEHYFADAFTYSRD